VSAVALKQQAFGRRPVVVDTEAEQHAPHYFPHPDQVDLFEVGADQVDLFHDAAIPETSRDQRSEAEGGAESSGEDSVSSHRKLPQGETRNVHRGQDRNLRSVLDQSLPDQALPEPVVGAQDGAPIDALGTFEFTEICGDALFQAFGRMSAPVQRIAQVANVNERTAKNWWEKKCAPGPIAMLRLMAHVPEFQGEMRRLAAMEQDLDPELERSIMETVRLMQRMPYGRGGR